MREFRPSIILENYREITDPYLAGAAQDADSRVLKIALVEVEASESPGT